MNKNKGKQRETIRQIPRMRIAGLRFPERDTQCVTVNKTDLLCPFEQQPQEWKAVGTISSPKASPRGHQRSPLFIRYTQMAKLFTSFCS